MVKHARRNQFFRDLPSRPFDDTVPVPDEFRAFFSRDVLPEIRFKGYKLAAKQEVALKLVHQLVVAFFPDGGVVADSRNESQAGTTLRMSVWDSLIAADFANVSLGSETSGMLTRYRATSKLLNLREAWRYQLVDDRPLVRGTVMQDEPTHYSLIVLHVGDFDPDTGKPIKGDGPRTLERVPSSDYFAGIEELIERINRSNTAHGWQAFHLDPATGKERVWHPNPMLRQVHCGELFRATRMYGVTAWSAQNISKVARRSMLIDGEPVAELDYSGMSTRMLYHRKRVDFQGDVYQPEEVFPEWHATVDCEEQRAVVRDFVKRATCICWNVDSKKKAQQAIQGILHTSPEKSLLSSALKTDSLTVSSMLERLEEVHGPLAEFFFSEIGLELMTADGKLMLQILKEFANLGKPCLGIHDAVVVKSTDAKLARRIMREKYELCFNFTPTIKQVI